MDFLDDIMSFIDKYMKLELEKYVSNKFDILQEIKVIIFDVANENYGTKNLNEKI